MTISRRNLIQNIGAAAAAAALPAWGEWSEIEASERRGPGVRAGEAASLIRLNRNESPYGPGERTRAAIREAILEPNRYPAGELDALTNAIAGLHGVKPEQITLGCGSSDLLRVAADAFLGPGKSLVQVTPTFEVIARDAQANGAEVRSVPLAKDYLHDLDGMLRRIDGSTSLVYVCNPNNPTGTLTPQRALEEFVGKIPSGTHVLMDEAYHDYVAHGSDYKSWVSRAGNDDRLIVLRTFSKVYGLAGLRIGYSVASAATAKRLAAHRLQFAVSLVGARAAKAAAEDAAHVKEIAHRNAEDRREFFRQAERRKVASIASQTNFALLRTERPGREVGAQLRESGVLISAGYPSLDNYIRVSFGLPEEMRSFWGAWDNRVSHRS